jgi:hypothetical protein
MIALLTLLACAPTEPLDTSPAIVPEREVPPPTIIDERPAKLIAMGDVHGDFKATKKALKLAGLIDGQNDWIGGETWVVQTGDQLDREGGEEKILELFEQLADQAHQAGGAFYSLLGNHEVMNVDADFRYVTVEGFEDFANTSYDETDAYYDDFEPEERGRAAAFRPGGEWAMVLSDHNVIMQIGDTLFVHGGVLPDHVDYGLEQINKDTRKWMRAKTTSKPTILSGDDAPIWTRLYSSDEDEPDCDTLQQALDAANAKYMVVAHTVWDSINPACDGKVWRIDVGMSAYYGGTPMVLEMMGDSIAPVTE